MQNFKTATKVWQSLFLTICFTCSSLTEAQNNVVVIPLHGDGIKLSPTDPVAPDDRSLSEFRFNYLDGIPSPFVLSVVDRITGLEWRRRSVPSGINTGSNHSDILLYCLNSNFDGKNDWRIPTFAELASIVNFSLNSPATNTSVFPNTRIDKPYITQSSRAFPTPLPRFIDFNDGSVDTMHLSGDIEFYVRCVRN